MRMRQNRRFTRPCSAASTCTSSTSCLSACLTWQNMDNYAGSSATALFINSCDCPGAYYRLHQNSGKYHPAIPLYPADWKRIGLFIVPRNNRITDNGDADSHRIRRASSDFSDFIHRPHTEWHCSARCCERTSQNRTDRMLHPSLLGPQYHSPKHYHSSCSANSGNDLA